MRVKYGTQHLVFGQLFSLRLNHQHRVLGARDDHVELAVSQCGITRIKDVTVGVGKADARTADGTIEGAT